MNYQTIQLGSSRKMKIMKKTLLGFLMVAIITFSFTQKNYKVKGNQLDMILSQFNTLVDANAECNTPIWWYGTCNQRVESIQSSCERNVTVITYWANSSKSGVAVGVGYLSATGTISMQSGYSTAYESRSSSTETYSATRVNCPTDGNNNDCVQHVPC